MGIEFNKLHLQPSLKEQKLFSLMGDWLLAGCSLVVEGPIQTLTN